MLSYDLSALRISKRAPGNAVSELLRHDAAQVPVQESNAESVPVSPTEDARRNDRAASPIAQTPALSQGHVAQPQLGTPGVRSGEATTPPVTAKKPSYTGPLSGVATWTGKLNKNDTLTIIDGTPSTGVLSGAGLPGVPVRLIIDQTNLGLAEMPNGSNGYRRLVLRSHGKHEKITIHWSVAQKS